jgi:hypothetical protein
VRVGAILTLAGARETEGEFQRLPPRSFFRQLLTTPSRWQLDLLGRSILDRTLDKIREVGAVEPIVLTEGGSNCQVFPSDRVKQTNFISSWEGAVSRHVSNGADALLLVRMSAYTDVDFSELMSFHAENGAPITHAYDSEGSLDIAVVDASYLRGGTGTNRNVLGGLIAKQERYFYRGYVNRLTTANQLRVLVQDGLQGTCGLHPIGNEVKPHVWLGAGAEVDSTAEIQGPAFIGAGARIGACCAIREGSTVERNSEIDCGTSVEASSVLTNTYVGVGLRVRRSIVGERKLFHLDREVEIDFADRRLLGATTKASLLLAAARSSTTYWE